MKNYKGAIIEKCELMAEVGLTYKAKTSPADRVQVSSSLSIYEFLRNIWNNDRLELQEEMVVVLLNKANQIVGWSKISCGSVDGTVCDPKLVFQLALLHNACSVVLAHNHPSGNLKPSQGDIQITKKLVAGAALLDMKILDHLIITGYGYYSFVDEGLI